MVQQHRTGSSSLGQGPAHQFSVPQYIARFSSTGQGQDPGGHFVLLWDAPQPAITTSPKIPPEVCKDVVEGVACAAPRQGNCPEDYMRVS